MPGNDYLIEILLTARDEASAKIRALQRQVDDLRASAAGRNVTSDLEKGFDDLGESAGNAATEVERHNKQAEELRRTAPQHRQALQEHARAHDQAAESVGDHADATKDLIDSARRSEAAFGDQAEAMDDAEKAAARYQARLKEIDNAQQQVDSRFRAGESSLRQYADGLDRIAQAEASLARTRLGTPESQDLLTRSRSNRGASNSFGTLAAGDELISKQKELDRAVQGGQVTVAEARREYQNLASDLGRVSHSLDEGSQSARYFGRAADDAKGSLVELSGGLRDIYTQTKEVDQAQEALYSRFNSGQASLRQLADGLAMVRQRLVSLAREAPIGSEQAQGLLSRVRTSGADSRQLAAHASGQDLVSSYEDFKNSVKAGEVTTAEAKRGFQSFQSDFTKISRSFEDGSEAARYFGRAADDAGKKLGNIPLAQSSGAIESWAARLSKATDSVGIKVISLSAALRGFRVVGIVGLIQVLDTAITSLAGSLVAVGSDAIEAGAALGGSFASGLAQSVPVLTVVLAGLERIKSVLDAVKLSQQIRQQNQFDPTQSVGIGIQTNEGLISAQQGLVDAYNNVVTAQLAVKESQIELTQARIDAIRNIQDLTIAEKTAAEQALGARLSVAQAEQQLLTLEQTGGSQLQLQQAQLAVQEAKTGQQSADLAVPRSRQDLARARRQGVAGSVGVMSAVEARRQALLQQQRAPTQVLEAQQQLELAKLTAASPSGYETSSQGQLNYLLGQMSGPEKTLYTALNKLEADLRSPSSPLHKIGDAFVAPFAQAVEQLTAIFSNPKLMAPLEKLANDLGKAFGKIINIKGHIKFFEDMTKDADANVPHITGIILALESLFQSIAKAAAPALHMLLGDLDTFLTHLSNSESSAKGQKKLTAEFDVWAHRLETIVGTLRAFHGLLKALGEDAAPAGDKAFGSLTGTLNSATDWVKSHGPEVRKFFQDAISALSVIGGILVTVGKTMLSVFNLGSLQTFGAFANQVLIPAIGDVAKAIGFVMKIFMDFINLFGSSGRGVLIAMVAGFAGLLVINKVTDAFLGATRGARALWDAMKVFKESKSIGDALKTFGDRMNGIRDSSKHAATGVKNAKTDIDNTLSAEEGSVGEKTAVIDEEMRSPGIAAQGVKSKVATGAAETEAALTAEGTAVGAETGIIDTEMAAPGVAAAGVPIAVATAAATTESELAVEDTAVAGETAAMGLAFTRLLGPIALAAGAIYELQKHGNTVANSLDKKLGLNGTIYQMPSSVQTPAELKKSIAGFAGGILNAKQLQEAYQQELPILQQREAAMKKHGLDVKYDLTKPLIDTANTWANTFQGINSTTGNVLTQVKQSINTNLTDIKGNVGTGSKQAAVAIVTNFVAGYQAVLDNTQKTAKGASDGIGKIAGTLDHALKVLGVKLPKGASQLEALQTASNIIMPQLEKTPAYASGGWVSGNREGGFYRAGEGGHDEMVLTTDPRQSSRQSALLGAYLKRAPFAAGGLIKNAFPGSITAPNIPGEQGEIRDVGQAAVDDVASAANKYLAGTGRGGQGLFGKTAIGTAWKGDWVQVMAQIAAAKHWSLAAWKAVINDESGGIPSRLGVPTISGSNAVGLSRAFGLGQFLGNTYLEYAKYGSTSYDPVKQIEAMAQYISDSYGNPDNALASENTRHFYAIGGRLRRGLRRFASGGRAPWGGEPVPIIAHEGERIANPSQWGEVARLAGTTPGGLDRHLGYDTGSPRQSFDVGGIASRQNYSPSSGVADLLGTFTGVNPSNSIKVVDRFFGQVKKGLETLQGLAKQMGPSGSITAFTNFASNAFQLFQNVMQNNVTQLQTRLTDAGTNAAYKKNKPGEEVISRAVGAGDQTIISGAEQTQQAMGTEQTFLQTTIAGIKGKIQQSNLIKNASKRKAALAALNTQYAQYESALTDLGDQMAQNLQTIYQDEQQAVQDELTRISNTYQTQQAGLQGQQSGAQAMGQYELLPALDSALAASSQAQVNALQDALGKAQAMGDASTAAQIQQQIDQLNSSIVQYTAQALQDAISAVQQTAQSSSSRTSLLSGLASVASSQGNFALSGSLSTQAYSNAMSGDQSQIASYTGNFLSPQQLAAVSAAQSGGVLNSSSMGNYGITSGSLLGQALSSGNEGAASTIIQALDGLGSDLATNTQSLIDNTAATDNAAASYIQSRGQFSSGVYGSIAGIIQTMGQMTGNVDLPALRQAYQGSNNSLSTANAGLSSTLAQDFGVNVQGMNPSDLIATLSGLDTTSMEAGMDPAQVTEFENLINGLLANTTAITSNNLQLATLNGQLTQPQSFTSTAFSSFRDAIFTGMGGLNPTYAASLGVANPTNPGLAGTNAPGQVAGSSPTTNIYPIVNPTLPAVDEGTTGQQIAFALKTPSR